MKQLFFLNMRTPIAPAHQPTTTRIKTLLTTLTIAVCLASCSSASILGTKKTELILTIKAEQAVNPDDNGRPSPVYLNLYELRTGKTFENAPYLGLLQETTTFLGTDLITSARLEVILPNTKRQETIVLNPATEHLGIAVELIRYQNTNTRMIIPILPNKSNKLVLIVGKHGLRYALNESQKFSEKTTDIALANSQGKQ